MKLLRLDELVGHDVCEFSYSSNEDTHWNQDSLYIDCFEFFSIGESIDQVIEKFHYYGPQKMFVSDWNKIKQLALTASPSLEGFFSEIDAWIKQDPFNNNWFWIQGV